MPANLRDLHREIAFMLIDNWLPDLNGIELAREVPAPTSFLPYEPDDQRFIRTLSDDSQTGRR